MLNEILLSGDERDTILGLCQHTLHELKEEYKVVPLHTKLMAARIGVVVCRIKGFVPHYNEAYIEAKGGWKRHGDVWEFTEPTVAPIDHITDFKWKDRWTKRVGNTTKPGTSPT